MPINALSLFANIGIGEVYLSEINVNTVVANELDEKRANFYREKYPNTDLIVGDITSDYIKKQIIDKSKLKNVELIIATPPCQGMSSAGKRNNNDSRNYLICDTIEIIKKVKPKYVLLENVPEQLNTQIYHNGLKTTISDYIYFELEKDYNIKHRILNAADYGVAQNRRRLFFLISRKDEKIWNFPKKEPTKKTLENVIGDLPSVDPYIKDVSEEEMLKVFPKYYIKKEKALQVSELHRPPQHIYRHVIAMLHTPTGKSAFDNEDAFKPTKKDGTICKGFGTTYKRQSWNKPGFTVTMNNSSISSQNNVHPGRFIGTDEKGNDLYSEPRVLTLLELMRVMSLPDNWTIPSGFSEPFVRKTIGEGIPPLLLKKIISKLPLRQKLI